MPAVIRNARLDRQYAVMAAEINRLDSVVGSLIDGLSALHLQVVALAAMVQSMTDTLPGEREPMQNGRATH